MEQVEVTKATATGAEALRPLLIHDLAKARAGVTAAAGLVPCVHLLTPPDGVAYAGLGFYLAMIDLLRGEFHGRENSPDIELIADCGPDAAQAHAALKRGVAHVVFTGHEAAARRLEDIAGQVGAVLLTSPPDALNISAHHDPTSAVRDWLGAKA